MILAWVASARADDQLAADDEALLVREREVDALGQGDDRRPQAC